MFTHILLHTISRMGFHLAIRYAIISFVKGIHTFLWIFMSEILSSIIMKRHKSRQIVYFQLVSTVWCWQLTVINSIANIGITVNGQAINCTSNNSFYNTELPHNIADAISLEFNDLYSISDYAINTVTFWLNIETQCNYNFTNIIPNTYLV